MRLFQALRLGSGEEEEVEVGAARSAVLPPSGEESAECPAKTLPRRPMWAGQGIEERCIPSLQGPGRSDSHERTHQQAQVEAAGLKVDALEYVAALTQMQPSHAAGLELMGERPFEALAAHALHPLAAIPPDSPTVRVHDGLQVLLALPTTTTTVRLRDVAAKLQLVDGGENVVAVVPLVRNDFLDHRRGADRRLDLVEGLLQRLEERLRVPLGAAVNRHAQDRPAGQVHPLLHLVRKVRAAILHLRYLRIRIVRILPLIVRQLLLPLAVETRQLRLRRRSHPRCLRQAPHELLVLRARVPTHDAP